MSLPTFAEAVSLAPGGISQHSRRIGTRPMTTSSQSRWTCPAARYPRPCIWGFKGAATAAS